MRPARRAGHAGRLRLFVAWNPDHHARANLAASLRALREHDWPLRWVDAGSLHVTVRFLGSVPQTAVPPVTRALARAAALHAPFAVEVGGLGAFPSLRRPRVLWIGVTPDERLVQLRHDVADALAAVGHEPDDQAWSPHITVARIGKATRAPHGVEAAALGYCYRARLAIRGIDLLRSVTGRAGARYECVATAGFGRT